MSKYLHLTGNKQKQQKLFILLTAKIMKNTLSHLLIAVLLYFASPAFSQQHIKEYVSKSVVPISTVEPDSTNYRDLEPIGEAIGNAHVVMLGEQDHGDAPTFLAKTRLIKYLHEKKSFNVLAFESDFFGLNYGWEHTSKQHPLIDSFILKNIFPIWTVCNTCSNLFYNYLPATQATGTPLVLTGFDSQQYLTYSYYNLSRILDSVFHSFQLPIVNEPNYNTQIRVLIDSPKKWIFFPPKDTTNASRTLGYLKTIRDQISARVDANNFWLYVIDNLQEQTEAVLLHARTKQLDFEGRDKRMALNLKWLIEQKFKGQKIIVWAASYHISKNIQLVDDKHYKHIETMGGFLNRIAADPKSIYTLGFTSYQGIGGRIGMKSYKVRPFKNDGFETWLASSPYAFVDFTKFNLENPGNKEAFYGSMMGHWPLKAPWNNIFDGVFFIKDMYRCVRINPSGK
jgi:erythromycin esterase